MSDHATIRREAKNRIVEEQDCKCAYCNQDISERSTIEHILPVAVAKWCGVSLRRFNDRRNLCAICYKCNLMKGSSVLSKKEYKLKLGSKYDEFESFYDENIQLIELYENIVNSAYAKNKGVCDCCKKKIVNKRHMDIRRRDKKGERVIDNSVIVHATCSESYRFIQKKGQKQK